MVWRAFLGVVCLGRRVCLNDSRRFLTCKSFWVLCVQSWGAAGGDQRIYTLHELQAHPHLVFMFARIKHPPVP